MLTGRAAATSPAAIVSGTVDAHFVPFDASRLRRSAGPLWLQLQWRGALHPPDFGLDSTPALDIHADRLVQVQLYGAGESAPRPVSVSQPEFGGAQESVFLIEDALRAGHPLYVRIEGLDRSGEPLRVTVLGLTEVLARGAAHARTIALAFGALAAMAFASLAMWAVLVDALFLIYAVLVAMLALYIAAFSGQAWDWPWLAALARLGSYGWNVPIALAGAAAALFVREIADLRLYSPREYRLFGWLAALFIALACANLLRFLGWGALIAALGNLLFVAAAAWTLIVAFLAWRRGSRAAGWFLLAWGLLEGCTIAAAGGLLFRRAAEVEALVYEALPSSMVAAAVLIALAVADRVRAHRRALTEAERRAQIDPLTGVLNRRSLIERLDAACLRARARGLPVTLLFIDLDHFKQINDSYGHAAGDACLAAIIEPIKAELRQSDVVGRYGGEEFVVILNDADATAAHPIAQRILERIAGTRVETFGAPIQVTCSIGVAASDTLGAWGEELLRYADSAVYGAKRAGRNQVRVAQPLAA